MVRKVGLGQMMTLSVGFLGATKASVKVRSFLNLKQKIKGKHR